MLEVAVHERRSKGGTTIIMFHSEYTVDGGIASGYGTNLDEIVHSAAVGFAVPVTTDHVVSRLTFVDLLKEPKTCSEFHVAILDPNDEIDRPDHVEHLYDTTRWVPIADLATQPWRKQRSTLVRQLRATLSCFQDHYITIRHGSHLEQEKSIYVQRLSDLARRIAGEANRPDLLHGVTIRGSRWQNNITHPDERAWYDSHGVKWLLEDQTHEKAAEVRAAIELAEIFLQTKFAVDNPPLDRAWWLAGALQWLDECKHRFNMVFGGLPSAFLAEQYEILLLRLAAHTQTPVVWEADADGV